MSAAEVCLHGVAGVCQCCRDVLEAGVRIGKYHQSVLDQYADPEDMESYWRWQAERLRHALGAVVDRDWTYIGQDADTANPESLINVVKRGRSEWFACWPAPKGWPK